MRTACTKTANIRFNDSMISFVHLLYIDFDIPLHLLTLLAKMQCFLRHRAYSVYRQLGHLFFLKVMGNNTGLVWSVWLAWLGWANTGLSLSFPLIYHHTLRFKAPNLSRTHKNSWLAHPLCCFCPVLLVAVAFFVVRLRSGSGIILPILTPLVLLSSDHPQIPCSIYSLLICFVLTARVSLPREIISDSFLYLCIHFVGENGEIEWSMGARKGDTAGGLAG